jgi:CheY-like chemotaxis protein
VLVIDDEIMVATMIRRALGRDHEVVTLTDPIEALRQLEQGHTFDLILCDLMMPNATGMDVHAAVVKHDPALAERMVFITGGAFTEQAREFMDTTANARIEKPIDATALRAFVNERLAGGST